MNEAFKLDEVADLNLPSDLPTTSGQRTMSMPLPMISKHAGIESPNAMKNVVPGTYNFHSCANVTFNIQYGPTCTSNALSTELTLHVLVMLRVSMSTELTLQYTKHSHIIIVHQGTCEIIHIHYSCYFNFYYYIQIH